MSTTNSSAILKAKWDRCHNITTSTETSNNNALPSPATTSPIPLHLYTDENPATTIKGTGFKNKAIAERTIHLTSQPGVRYKQYWTIRAMRERAAYHPHPTEHMKEAMCVFDEWLTQYQPPAVEERKEQEGEWKEFKRLCESKANQHSYGKGYSQEDIRMARNDTKAGIDILLKLLSSSSSNRSKITTKRPQQEDPIINIKFPITAWTALFGAPGLHGYGRHNLESNISKIYIDGSSGLEEITGTSKALSALGLPTFESLTRIYVRYDRDKEAVTEANVETQHRPGVTLATLWGKSRKLESEDMLTTCRTTTSNYDIEDERGKDNISAQNVDKLPSWSCNTCTFEHKSDSKRYFLACELCGTNRKSNVEDDTEQLIPTTETTKLAASLPHNHGTKRRLDNSIPIATTSKSKSLQWSFLRAPTSKDIQPRKRQKGFDAPPPMMEYLIVLDFEWTANDKRKMEPVAEITQFPSVCMKLLDGQAVVKDFYSSYQKSSSIQNDQRIPHDLRLVLSPAIKRQDAVCVSIFDSFVRPTLNPTLTKFSVDLTAITQGMVDMAPTIDIILARYLKWLHSLNLVDEKGTRTGNWAFATWGDCDIMTTLRLELQYKSINLPQCFDSWINLKDDSIFKRQYRRKPRGGLRSCVESVGMKWEGRAHNGLVDSINTAKIVRDMVQSGFRFTKTTRGLDKEGIPFGQ